MKQSLRFVRLIELRTFVGALWVLLVAVSEISFSQGTWVQKASLPAAGRMQSFAFAIGDSGYVGSGIDGSNSYNDFWLYNSIINTWTQKANFIGGGMAYGLGFAIGNKGYAGIGTTCPNQLFEYDPLNNIWTQKATLPGNQKLAAGTFVIGNEGYVIGGSYYSQELWVYNQSTNSWSQKANYLGAGRTDIDRMPFVLNNKAYVGLGIDTINGYNDFWEYNPILNTYTQKANFPGLGGAGAVGFAIFCTGYVGLGGAYGPTANFGEYDPFTNTWNVISSLTGNNRIDALSFVISNRAFVGLGVSSTNYYSDLWEFIPSIGAITATVFANINTLCNGEITSISASGGINYSWSNGSTNNTIIVSPTMSTSYSVIVSDVCGSDTASITITVNQPPVPLISGNTSICTGDSTILTTSGGVSYSWSTGATTSSLLLSPSSTTIYSVTVVNASGCTGTSASTIIVDPCSSPIDCPNIFIPNAFSPNGDNENDFFLAQGTNCVKDFFLAIYNRWGEKVFESTDPAFKWDGTNQAQGAGDKGQVMNTQVVTYYLKATLIDGNEISKKGNISLVR
ncbi:MAG: gliding motility-associated C-terminal domain-containing protein [Bacteroidetes bacterium]|nr:gliding motility-associated C-terminal domain-containing protein [Bacteroidota bacterium]